MNDSKNYFPIYFLNKYCILIIFLYLIHNLICQNQFRLENRKSYPKVKQLSSEEYLIILNDAIYIYNDENKNLTQIYK